MLFRSPLTPTRLARTINALNSRMGFNDYQFMVADPSIWNHPEGGESIAETMMKEGMRLIEADNERVNGLARVREYLATAPDGKPYMQAFKCCTNLIRTLPALSYDERKIEDVDTSLDDHCYDSVRYMLMSRPARVNQVENPITDSILYDYKKKTGQLQGDGEVLLEM